jgi:retron-type reverse transcriptase
MGFFDWLRSLLFGEAMQRPRIVRAGSPAAPPVRPAPFRPAPPVPSPPPAPPRPAEPKVSYEAEEFLPISRKELREKSATQEIRTSPWWGRTDTIPPGDDPRTKLIDRALVTRGYLTPDQLVEIHRVGDLMLRFKGEEALLYQEAGRAVERMKEERAALKARKKAEAEERRRLRAEAVAARKAADIVFLGRGVSGGLSNRSADAARLAGMGLPVLATPADAAKALGVPVPRLRWLAFHSDAATISHYTRFRIPKKSGGTREISAPHRDLAAAQRWILENVLAKLPPEAPSHGFVPGRSTVTNARPHVKRAVVVNLDLKDFFPSVTFPRVRGIFEGLGYSPAVATIFALLATEAPRKTVEYDGKRYHVAVGPRALPQGASTSPALSNRVARRLDRRLAGLAAKLGWTYTRYADDLTFSGDTHVPKGEKNPKSVAWLLARTRHILEDEGFEVNEKKLRVQRRNAAQVVTGIVVNEKPSAGREERRRLRAILHRARFEGIEKQNRIGHPHYAAWLRGHVAYVSMVDPAQGQKLKVKLDALLASGK